MSEPDLPEPDLSGPDVVEPGTVGTRFTSVHWFADIDSTNRYLLGIARQGGPEGLVAVADHQHAGRGRLGRRWEAPSGTNLLCSVLLRPALETKDAHWCTMAVALAAADACDDVAAVRPDLKWPNDLLVGGRKLAGVLAEIVPGPPAARTRPAVVVGLGVNVGWPVDELLWGADTDLPDLSAVAISLAQLTGAPVDRRTLLDTFLSRLEDRLRTVEGTVPEYRRRCATVGQTVRVELATRRFTGRAVDVTAEGHLVVDTDEGRVTVTAGDVVHLGAAP